jgi:hypothetical protein
MIVTPAPFQLYNLIFVANLKIQVIYPNHESSTQHITRTSCHKS